MANIVYVLTSNNRGISLGIVKKLLARPATTVFVSVRNEAAAATLTTNTASIDNGDAIRQAFAVATAGTIDRVDVLVDNAAMVSPLTPSITTTAEDLCTSFEVNTISPLLTFQGLWPLMDKPRSAGECPPKFIAITSCVDSIECLEPVPADSYGPSKSALNWITNWLHLQHNDSGLVSVAIRPGWVQTDAGRFSAKSWGYKPGLPDTIEDSADEILKVTDKATRETASGKFVSQTGKAFPW
ncbi:short chain dehydrogenase/ reductase [Colletotrichum navitas]|uniref:Short chain dehydrogenase/ reductase n=1 Tax=Colletotrichum navitas TaxID=681940 RepID=A0AAD8PMU1_9PEZI|nr:short chain dehydrogenase/ reductase [Colletotrichum navitas]KAK1573062.1 short chain dehydrogenase/ reductase [Colletotrichum navitas]